MMYRGFQKVCLVAIVSLLISGFFFVGAMAEEDYPELYGKELPRYPKAKLVSTGRQVSSLKDGLSLQLVSSDPVQTIAAYYEEKMKNLGWTVPEQRFPNDQVYVGNFTKGDLYFLIKIMRLDPDKDETRIDIAYAKR